MHHVLRFYTAHQELLLKLYIFAAKLSKLPVIGKFVKILMNWYAFTQHGAFIITPEEAKMVINAATNLAIGDCKCRKIFNNCDDPIRTDIVLGIGHDVFTGTRKDEYVNIDKAEAEKIIDECSERGLVHSLIKCKGEVYAICNCCPCCCVPLRLNKYYGIKHCWSRDKNAVNSFLITLEDQEV